ncbi:hypothetical protein CR513_57561, partial [Mucuna pruriens]
MKIGAHLEEYIESPKSLSCCRKRESLIAGDKIGRKVIYGGNKRSRLGSRFDNFGSTGRSRLDNMANNDRTLTEGPPASKIVNEVVVVDNQRLKNKITKLTSLVRQLAIGQHHNSPQ